MAYWKTIKALSTALEVYSISIIWRTRELTEAKRTASSSDKFFLCGSTDNEAAIFPVRFRGEDKCACA